MYSNYYHLKLVLGFKSYRKDCYKIKFSLWEFVKKLRILNNLILYFNLNIYFEDTEWRRKFENRLYCRDTFSLIYLTFHTYICKIWLFTYSPPSPLIETIDSMNQVYKMYTHFLSHSLTYSRLQKKSHYYLFLCTIIYFYMCKL